MHGAISHTSRHPPDIILRRSFTRPSTVLAVIEGLGMRLGGSGTEAMRLGGGKDLGIQPDGTEDLSVGANL